MGKRREDGERLLTRAEVAEIFQVSPSTVTRWAQAGKLPVAKTLGGHRRYEAKTIRALAQQFIPILTDVVQTNNEEEPNMESVMINVPTMYGDHHVLEVRRLLLKLAGVEDVYASSCFKTVEVTYDPGKTDQASITARLAKAGYLAELSIPVEVGAGGIRQAGLQEDTQSETFFRHTTAFEQTKHVVSFAQDIHYSGSPLWPCPGLGLIEAIEEEATT